MNQPRVRDADIALGLKMVEEEFDEESVAARWLTRALLDLKDARAQLKQQRTLRDSQNKEPE